MSTYGLTVVAGGYLAWDTRRPTPKLEPPRVRRSRPGDIAKHHPGPGLLPRIRVEPDPNAPPRPRPYPPPVVGQPRLEPRSRGLIPRLTPACPGGPEATRNDRPRRRGSITRSAHFSARRGSRNRARVLQIWATMNGSDVDVFEMSPRRGRRGVKEVAHESACLRADSIVHRARERDLRGAVERQAVTEGGEIDARTIPRHEQEVDIQGEVAAM